GVAAAGLPLPLRCPARAPGWHGRGGGRRLRLRPPGLAPGLAGRRPVLRLRHLALLLGSPRLAVRRQHDALVRGRGRGWRGIARGVPVLPSVVRCHRDSLVAWLMESSVYAT